jgi:hypothetical protein
MLFLLKETIMVAISIVRYIYCTVLYKLNKIIPDMQMAFIEELGLTVCAVLPRTTDTEVKSISVGWSEFYIEKAQQVLGVNQSDASLQHS